MLKKLFPPKQNDKAVDFERFIKPHVDYLYRMAYQFCGDSHIAEDLVQELLTKLYPKSESFADIDNFRAWLTTSLYNLFIDRTRQFKTSRVLYVNDMSPYEELSLEEKRTPENIAIWQQSIKQVQLAFSQLSDEHRSLLTLHDIEGYTLPELSEMLSIPLGTLKSRLFRARDRFKQFSSEMDVEEPFSIDKRFRS